MFYEVGNGGGLVEVRWEQDQHGMKPSQTLLPTAHTSFSSRVFLVLQLYFYLCLYLYLLEAITDFGSQSTHKLFLSWISCIVIIFSSLFVIVFVFA